MKILTVRKKIENLNKTDRILIIILITGTVISFVSLFRGIMVDRQVQVEYIHNSSISEKKENIFFIDIEGAVISPGVYELVDGSRIKDVLVLAGGLSEKADREFCEKNINMAEVLVDGQKIYIPFLRNTDAEVGYSEANIQEDKISINSATASELDTLWGIGESRAESIVKNRPYKTLDDLVLKGVIPKSVLERNRDRLSVF